MTKKEAKAILACQKKILAAIISCKGQLTTHDEILNCEHYWGASVIRTMRGAGWGSCPISRAEEKLRD